MGQIRHTVFFLSHFTDSSVLYEYLSWKLSISFQQLPNHVTPVTVNHNICMFVFSKIMKKKQTASKYSYRIDKAVQSIKKRCVLCDLCSDTIEYCFWVTGSHDIEAIKQKCWIFKSKYCFALCHWDIEPVRIFIVTVPLLLYLIINENNRKTNIQCYWWTSFFFSVEKEENCHLGKNWSWEKQPG